MKISSESIKHWLKKCLDWVIIWAWFSIAMFSISSVYWVLSNTWTDPSTLEASTWSVLSSQSWNSVLSNQKILYSSIQTQYSTNEKFTWTYWIDWKPIYRKVETFASKTVTNSRATLWVAPQNIWTIVNSRLLYSWNWAVNAAVRLNSGNIQAWDSDTYTVVGYIIEYTKTTD